MAAIQTTISVGMTSISLDDLLLITLPLPLAIPLGAGAECDALKQLRSPTHPSSKAHEWLHSFGVGAALGTLTCKIIWQKEKMSSAIKRRLDFRWIGFDLIFLFRSGPKSNELQTSRKEAIQRNFWLLSTIPGLKRNIVGVFLTLHAIECDIPDLGSQFSGYWNKVLSRSGAHLTFALLFLESHWQILLLASWLPNFNSTDSGYMGQGSHRPADFALFAIFHELLIQVSCS